VVIVKPTAPFGPRDVKPTPTGRLVVEAASGRMPAYVNTGLNVVHVDDVAAGHLLAYEKGAVGETYILGGENRTLQWILETVAELTGQRPPRIRLPHWFVTPMAYLWEGTARIRGSGEPMMTVDSVRMSRKLMYFSTEKARRELGYSPRPAVEALRDEIEWFYKHGYVVRKRIKKHSSWPSPDLCKGGVSLDALRLSLALVKSQPLPLPDRSTEYLIGNSGAKEPSVFGPPRKTRKALSGCWIVSLTAVVS